MIPVTFRPIDAWPGSLDESPVHSPFKASFSQTLDLLDRELRALDAEHIVVQIAVDESAIRLDGWPRAEARPQHPGVVVAFESRFGSLKYATARYTPWQSNLRAVALGLEALRKVDRYGITKRGEQYAGWKQLGTGEETQLARGHKIIAEHGGDARAALRATHPDAGGDEDDFKAVNAARSSR